MTIVYCLEIFIGCFLGARRCLVFLIGCFVSLIDLLLMLRRCDEVIIKAFGVMSMSCTGISRSRINMASWHFKAYE